MPVWTPAQELAMQLRGRDILVSAAAGSGKTATLTERIIRALTQPEEGQPRGDISRMLIVTFTRAAAAELRARIAKAISEAIAQHPDDRYLYRQLLALSSAQICTIDSFYQQPVRENFERLGLPSSFRLADDAELTPLKVQTLDHLIDQHYANACQKSNREGTPLDALDGNAFALALDDLLPRRDTGKLSHDLLDLFEKLIAFPQGVGLLRRSAERLEKQAELPFDQTDEGKVLLGSLCEELQYYRDALQPMCELLQTDDRTLTKYFPSFVHDLSCVKGALDLIQSGQWQKGGELLCSYEPISLKSITKKETVPLDLETMTEQRKEIVDKLKKFKDSSLFADAQKAKDQMLRTARAQRMLYTLLSDYDKAIKEQKNRRGVLDFSDVRRYLLQLLLDKEGRPTDAARALSDRYDAVYIDEYQDVDTVQDLIFSIVGSGGKRFMVGDIKQSIYSFRGAEPSIFANYRKEFPLAETAQEATAPNGNGSCVFMSENFRCDRSVIDFTNAVCSYAFEACPDTLGYQPEDDLKFSKQLPSPNYESTPARVVILEKASPFAKEDVQGDPEAIYVAREIKRLLNEQKRADGKPFCPSDVAILLRSTTMAPALIQALRSYGIPVSHAARDDLAHHPDMTLMVNLLSVIDNPHDDVSLMGLFASATSPLSLTDVFLARRQGKQMRSLYDDLCTAVLSTDVPWSDATRRTVQAFLTKLEAWRTLSVSLPIDRLLRQLYSEPFLLPLANTPALLCLYDYARHYQNSAFCGLYQFLQYFRELLQGKGALAAAGLQTNDDAVRIMTIHGSKGLEFPAVFVCGCAKTFNTEDTRSPLMFDATLGVATREYRAEDGSVGETVTRHAVAHNTGVKQTEEEMRLLYVALTRARERLYVTASLLGRAEGRIHSANRPTRGNRHVILSAKCYLDWILAAISPANRTGSAPPAELLVLDKQDYLALGDASAGTPRTTAAEQALTDDTLFYRSILEEHKSFVDTNAAVRLLPTKAAASKLRVAMLDELWLPEEFGSDTDGARERTDAMASLVNTEEYVTQRIQLMQSAPRSFEDMMQSEQSISPAERGTATHLFLQHCDFARLSTGTLESEITRLVDGGLLPRRSSELLRRDHLQLFLQSDLFALLSRSDVTVRREQHFDRFLPYSRLTRNPSLAKQIEGYTLYVQGSLDLIVEQEDGTLWLCDYKTDRILAQDEASIREQLLAAHADQLLVYTEALEGLFGRRPDHIVIYSLPLGRMIDLSEHILSKQ